MGLRSVMRTGKGVKRDDEQEKADEKEEEGKKKIWEKEWLWKW
jgi:hypothetical protein